MVNQTNFGNITMRCSWPVNTPFRFATLCVAGQL